MLDSRTSRSSRFTRTCILLIAVVGCGGSNTAKPDAGDIDAPPIDAAPDAEVDAPPVATFGLTAIFPSAASRTVDTELTISGFGITGTPTIHLTNCDQPQTTYDLVAGTVTATSITTLLAADPTRVQGAYTVQVTNGDGMTASLTCALTILAEPPPTVTLVIPSTAYRGAVMDNINSDVTLGIQGTGFVSTPSVRWVSTTDPGLSFEALYVGFVSSTQLTAVIPSETLAMPAGTYNVFVTNPNNLSAEWMNGTTPGIFTVTDIAPPEITDVTPARLQNGVCTTTPMTISGSGFGVTATAWYVVPAGTVCAGSTTDPNGLLLCPFAIDAVTATAITVHLASCPALGPYPVVVINPDNQADYWYSIEITPSSDGHLSTGSWETQENRLETPRWKHALQYGFDSFSNAFVYVAGGQDATGAVLGSVETSQFDLFGTPGPFHHIEQYGGPATPRVANDLTVPREGSTLVRVGKSLFSIGGTTARSDTTTIVAAATTVERAEILSYAQMPGIKQPVAVAPQGLPVGSWYYRVSAIGPWGESLATREVVAINKGGQIQICWVVPTTAGAVSYNIYRSLAADGRAGTSVALAYEAAGIQDCFIDDGVETRAPAPGTLRGTLATGGTFIEGTYSYRVSATVPLAAGGTYETHAGYVSTTTIAAADVTGGMQTINVAWDAVPITGVTYNLYRLDPASGTYKLVTGASGLTTTTFADTNIALDPANIVPRAEVRSLPSGSLSRWSATTPALTTAREGLDGVVIAMDPATSNNLVGRIIVAGGRDGTTGTYGYHKSAESLGVYLDGTTDAAWSAETPLFANARGYYALLTTQDRNTTPFPPPPEPPPCGDCGMVINHGFASTRWDLGPTTTPVRSIANVASAEPVYVIAVMGDDAFQATNNTGRNDFEACPVDMVTGHLSCGTTWITQASAEPAGAATFGEDAVLYFSYLYPFAAISRETVGALGTTIQFMNAAIGRFPIVADLAAAMTDGQILASFQSASTKFAVNRAYYQMTRLLAYVYVVGGFAESHLEAGVTIPAGPTGLVERHQQ